MSEKTIETVIKTKEIETTQELYKLLEGKDLTVLYFSSPDCGVCHAVLPKLLALLEEYPINIARIDIDRQREISGQFLVFTVPTVLIFQKGKEIMRESRFIDFRNIEYIIQSNFNNG